jgi:hypothetical protein
VEGRDVDLDRAMADIITLVRGDHVHLDEVVPDPPPPGSRLWMPRLVELAHRLRTSDGHWALSLPVGQVDPDRVRIATAEDVFDLASAPTIEPPSVHRVGDHRVDPWPGQQISDASSMAAGVMVTTTLSRSPIGREQHEPWNATITFSVTPSRRG